MDIFDGKRFGDSLCGPPIVASEDHRPYTGLLQLPHDGRSFGADCVRQCDQARYMALAPDGDDRFQRPRGPGWSGSPNPGLVESDGADHAEVLQV